MDADNADLIGALIERVLWTKNISLKLVKGAEKQLLK